MQPANAERAQLQPTPPSVTLIVAQCVALSVLFTGSSLVLAKAIGEWLGFR